MRRIKILNNLVFYKMQMPVLSCPGETKRKQLTFAAWNIVLNCVQ